MSWKPEVYTGSWSSNALRFATKEEAEASGKELLSRWFVPTDSRAVESEDPVNYEANYLDLGGFQKKEQLKFSEGFEKKGIVGICGVGTASGMSNIMAAYGVQQLDKPESIQILDACVDMVPDTEHSRPLYWGWAIEGIIPEFFMEGAYFDEGQLQYISPRSYPEVVSFRPPAGQIKVATTVHSEPIILSETFKDRGLKHASWKIGFDTDFEEKMTFMRDLGLFNTEPIEVEGQKVSPRALLLKLLYNQPPETKKTPDFRGHMIVVVKGEQAGQKVEYTIRTNSVPRSTISPLLEMPSPYIMSNSATWKGGANLFLTIFIFTWLPITFPSLSLIAAPERRMSMRCEA